MAEKTKKSNEGSGRSPARKPAAKRPGVRKDDDLDVPATRKTAKKPKKTAATRKPKAKKATAKKSTAKSARRSPAKDAKAAPKSGEKLASVADPKETLAERRIAGGRDAEPPTASANQNQPTAEAAPAPTAQSGTERFRHEVAGPLSQVPKRTKPDTRVRPGESAESGPRPNTLVPTNGIHTTERRFKRGLHRNRGVMFLIAATLLGILILGEQTTPPDMSEFEQQIAASRSADPHPAGPHPDPGATPTDSPAGPSAGPGLGIVQPRVERTLAHDPGADRFPGARPWELDDHELAEMERLLARLDLEPSVADGIVDQRTETAIRLYQEIAGLPVNGAASRALLADMREVADILDNGG